MTSTELKYKQIFQSGRYSNLLHLSDARLITEDGSSFDVHKIILAKSSDFFRAMFSEMYKCKYEYKISSISGECMSNILLYIYTKNIYVTQKNIKDLLIAADYFLLQKLYLELKHYVKCNITDANCLKLCYAAYQLSEKEIFQCCFTYIQTRFEKIILNYNYDLVDLPQELLKRIVSNRNLNVQNERTVWKTIIHWTQACSAVRLSNVPSLLSSLAIDEIDEKLATEIINHDIVKNNIYTKFLKEATDFSNLNSKRNLLINYLHNYAIDFKLQNFRIPGKLNVISVYVPKYGERGTCDIYISYDETHTLCRRLTHLNFEPEYLTVIGSELYLFERFGPRCTKFNLITMKWKPMKAFNYFGHTVLVIEECIYILGLNGNGSYDVKMYNVEKNRWFRVASLENACNASAVVVGKNMLTVGLNQTLDGMVAQILNPVSHLWSPVSSPSILRSHFELVTYNERIYMIGGFNSINEAILTAEVYDSETDIWTILPVLPVEYSCVAAAILNEQMILYDFASMLTRSESAPESVRWNDAEKCWEKLENLKLPENLHQYRMCSVFDIETIKFLTKQNRNLAVNMENCPLNCL